MHGPLAPARKPTGITPGFFIITDDKDRVAVLLELRTREDLELDNPEDCLKKIDIMFTHGICADELPGYFPTGQEDNRCLALQAIFRGYVGKLVAENHLDFGSVLHFARELLTTKPRIARQVRTVYRYVCVDEFQDTNLAQYGVLRLVIPDATANLFVVADDDQTIFQWNVANPKRLKEFGHDYQPRVIQLPENYRCSAEVVEIANRLIAHNPNRHDSKEPGVSHKRAENPIKLQSYEDCDSEIEGLITEIRPIPKNRRELCLVVARSNKLLAQVMEATKEAGVGAEIVSRHQDFVSPLVQLLYYSLKLANSPDSRSILNKLCSAATRVNSITVSAEDVVAKAQVEDLTPLRAFFSLVATSDALKTFAERGQALLCDSLDPLFVEASFREFDVPPNEEPNQDYDDDRENWRRISEEIRRSQGQKASLHVYLQEMDLSPKTKPLSKDCVRLQTVHTAKGVEFDNVFVIGLAEDQFPSYFAIKNGETAIKEERRNCFVAITRSSENLYLSYARNYFGWSKNTSRFLKEMGLLND